MSAAESVLGSTRVPFARTLIVDEAKDAVARVLASGWLTSGPEVIEFERDVAEKLAAPFAVAVSSCTAALEISLRALNLPPGSKVLCPTITFASVAHAIIHAGYMPVLIDANPYTLMPDAVTTAAAARAAGGADAMIVLHFAGQPAPVLELAEAAELPITHVIEDAAHAFGTWVGDRPVGALSRAACFSFYATKNLPIGEGGMITTADEYLAEFARRCRLNGMSRDAWKRYAPGSRWRYEISQAGLKANMTDVQAAIGRAQLSSFDSWQARRAEIARRYDDNLSQIGGLALPARPARGTHAWHLYVVRVTPDFGLTRDEFIAELSDRGIDCSVHFIPLHLQPYFQKVLGKDIPPLPNADAAFDEIVSLPLYPSLTDDDVDRVCDAVAELREPTPILRTAEGARAGDRTIYLEEAER
jgi:dTDP-4-amino-4,6-dideoxygalactose transaminase